MPLKMRLLALTLLLILTISGIVNGEASDSASESQSQSAMNAVHIAPPRGPSLLGVNAHHGIIFVYAKPTIKCGEYVKSVPQQKELVTSATINYPAVNSHNLLHKVRQNSLSRLCAYIRKR